MFWQCQNTTGILLHLSGQGHDKKAGTRYAVGQPPGRGTRYFLPWDLWRQSPVDKGIHALGAVFWRLAALPSIGVRPIRPILLPCQPPKSGTWHPKGICASVLLWCKALERSVLRLREAAVTQQNRKFVVENRAPLFTEGTNAYQNKSEQEVHRP